nr:AAA family ATPase [Pseudomonadota bacterium]
MKRHYYRYLQEWMANGHKKPLLLRGVRQCGKTHLLNHFGENEFSNFHYFNFEKEPTLSNIFAYNLDPQGIITQLSFHQNRPINITQDLVIFDEIQATPSALTSLK